MKHEVNEPGRTVQGWWDVRSGADVPSLRFSCFEFYSSVELCGKLRDFSGLVGGIVEKTGEFLGIRGGIWDGGLGWVAVGD